MKESRGRDEDREKSELCLQFRVCFCFSVWFCSSLLALLSFSVVSCFPFRCIRRGGGEDGETSDSWSRRNQSLSLSQPRIEERSVPFSLLSPRSSRRRDCDCVLVRLPLLHPLPSPLACPSLRVPTKRMPGKRGKRKQQRMGSGFSCPPLQQTDQSSGSPARVPESRSLSSRRSSSRARQPEPPRSIPGQSLSGPVCE